MSVINKMLRDLDQRQLPQAERSDAAHGQALRRGTSSQALPLLAGTRVARSGLMLGLAALLLALVAALAWWAWQARGRLPAADGGTPVAPLAGAVAPAPAALASAAAPVVAALPASAPGVEPVVAVVPAAVPAPVAPAPQKARVSSAWAPAPTGVSTAAATAGTGSVAVAVVTPSPAPLPSVSSAAGPDPQAALVRQSQAARETLAQAQALWAAGSHDAATELLQQALVVAQRGAAAVSNTAVLARELARMQLADGRAAAALELLTRLEPLLGKEADIWALRGSAAQRLGRHQDSVLAYATALQLRPNEQRWLLGSAVSLAALGHTAQASEMAARARALGPIGNEVQAYLRQAGVSLD